jgi:hypothetical protein
MKAVTKNLLKFSAVLFALTILFRFTLSRTLDHQEFQNAFFVSMLYGIIIFAIGSFFGRKDRQSLPLYDIGFRVHLATFLICSAIGLTWFCLI